MKNNKSGNQTTFCENLTLDSFHAIQPHGVLLILDRDFKITQYSENVRNILETSVEQLVTNPIFNFLVPRDKTVDTKSLLAGKDDFYKMTWSAERRNIPIFIHIHQRPKKILLEIERDSDESLISNDFFDLTQTIIRCTDSDHSMQSIKDLAETTCKNLLKITDYDRVIIYKFDPFDYSGVVIGEALKEGMESYQNLHFPANDVPPSVREMYLKITLRYIPTILADPVKIIPAINSIAVEPEDLSRLNLRMVAPVHVQYIKNMGLLSTASVGVIYNNKLWGIIACHNKEPKHLSLNLRMILLLSANAFSMQMSALEFKETAQQEANAINVQTMLASRFSEADSIKDALDMCYENIMAITGATGVSFSFQNSLFNYGNTPTDKQILELIKWLEYSKKKNIYTTSKLPAEYEESACYKDKACGLLAIKNSSIHDHYLLFYKPEVVKTIAWAGNPNEILKFNQKDYSPRNSFKTFLQKITDQSARWTNLHIKSAEFIRSIIVTKQLQIFLQDQATHDALTNLSNRTNLENHLAKETNRATRENKPFAILLVDIDYFKNINDSFGHLAGDEVLVAFSKLLTAHFRVYDYIFRYGGEEFLIILPGVDSANARKKADFLRKKVKKLKIPFNNALLPPVSISLGISIFPPHGADPVSLIAAADAALYQAKANGRDQTVVFEKPIQ